MYLTKSTYMTAYISGQKYIENKLVTAFPSILVEYFTDLLCSLEIFKSENSQYF
jgi:hypothetical protein